MIDTRKIVITGTHLTPAIELINQLQNDISHTNWDIYYVGRNYNSSTNQEKSIESKIIPTYNIKFYGINCGKFDRRWLPNTLRGIPQIFTALLKSYSLLQQIHPHAIVSFGGYVSVPVIISAWLLKIPSITHEQTQTLSLSTKINSIFCRWVALSFPIKSSSNKYLVTGNLLRQAIFKNHSTFFEKQKLNLKKHPLIYLTAGNQGSHHLNLTLKKILPELLQKYTIIHQTGNSDFKSFKIFSSKFPNYIVKNYIEPSDIGWIFHHLNLIITRAGANTIQEIATIKMNSIIIPLNFSQQNEQYRNAIWLNKKFPNNSIIIKDSELTDKTLRNSIDKLINKKIFHQHISTSPNLKLLKLIKTL